MPTTAGSSETRGSWTMQEEAADIESIWATHTHPDVLGSTRDTWAEATVTLLLGMDDAGRRAHLEWYEDTEYALLRRYLGLDYTRFVQTNARHLGSSGPGA